MNQCLKNLNKIEFVVTYACTGRCKHCSEGEHASCGEWIDPVIAADAVRKIAAAYDIKTVMTFGGEPLLHTDAVERIMTAAKEQNIPKRQVITNGYFSKNADRIREVAEQLAACKTSGARADSAEAQALVAKLQAHITANYYTCTDEILAGLGKMYVADERFKKNIDKYGEGTAEFAADAIAAYTK